MLSIPAVEADAATTLGTETSAASSKQPQTEPRMRRDRLKQIRHRHGLLATGETPPRFCVKPDWLTPRQRALLGQSPFVTEEAMLALREKERYMDEKIGQYAEQARELTRRIEAARQYELDGWEGAGGLSPEQAAMLRRCMEELSELEKLLAAIELRLAEITAEEDELYRKLKGPPLPSPEEERRIRQRLAELLAERQRLEEQRLLYLQRIDALRDLIGKLKGGQMPDGEDLDLQLRLALYGLGEIGDILPWETDPSWLAVQMPGWSYRLAVRT